MPSVSVIVPVYGAEKYLNRCIDSILAQTLADIEVILIDDGSPDGSPAICDEYAARDARVRVIHKENAGVSAARNSGLEIAGGEYIAFVDSDDFIDADMYEKMISSAKEYDCDVVMCDCITEREGEAGARTHEISSGYYDRKRIEREIFPKLLMTERQFCGTVWNIIYKRERFDLRFLEGVRFSEDSFFAARLLYCANSFYYLKGFAPYRYFINPISATHKYFDRWGGYLKLYDETERYFGGDEEYDFSHQLDLTLLNFVHAAIYNILTSANVDGKKEKIMFILNDSRVRNMFKRVKIIRLPVSTGEKIVLLCYKYRICIGRLIKKYEKTGNGF